MVNRRRRQEAQVRTREDFVALMDDGPERDATGA